MNMSQGHLRLRIYWSDRCEFEHDITSITTMRDQFKEYGLNPENATIET